MLGDSQLSNVNLLGYSGEIAQWSGSLALGADLLFYGCDLASNQDGQLLLESISALTGADVAASEDLTGHVLSEAIGNSNFQQVKLITKSRLANSLSNIGCLC